MGAKYFCCLDMRSGNHQVEMEEVHTPVTAFSVGPLGFYQCERMPCGLTNAPAKLSECMGALHMKECFTFIHDVQDYNLVQ